jgi:hypothetical protein
MASSVRSSVFQECDERAWPRIRVAVPASITVGHQDYPARVTNIAPGGAMLETEAELQMNGRIIVRCGTVCAEAKVIWKNPGTIGVSFLAPLAQAEVDEQVSRAEALAARRSTVLPISGSLQR